MEITSQIIQIYLIFNTIVQKLNCNQIVPTGWQIFYDFHHEHHWTTSMTWLQIECSFGFGPNKASKCLLLIHFCFLLQIKFGLLEKLAVYFYSLKWFKIIAKVISIFDLTPAIKFVYYNDSIYPIYLSCI